MPHDTLLTAAVPAEHARTILALLPDPCTTRDLLCVVEADAGPVIGHARVYFQRTQDGWACYRVEPVAGPVYDVPF